MIRTKRHLFYAFFLFLLTRSSHAMESVQKTLNFIHDDSSDANNILPITVNLENDQEEIIYSSQWNLPQLQYIGTLHNQYSFDQDSALSLSTSHISKKQFKTAEKIALLLAITKNEQNEDHQKCQLKEFFKESKRSTYTFSELLQTADFLAFPLLFETCLEHIAEKTIRLVQKNKIISALALLDTCNTQHLSVYLGNKLIAYSPKIESFLKTLDQKCTLHRMEEKNDHYWYYWSGQDNLLFKSPTNSSTIKFWHDKAIRDIPVGTHHYLYSSWMCPTTKRLFCLFANQSLHAYDLETSALLGSTQTKHSSTSSIRYAPSENLLFLIGTNDIKMYSLHDDEKKQITFIHGQMPLFTTKLHAFAYDQDNKIFYLALQGKGIHTYNVTKDKVKKYFFTSEHTKRREITSLCLSPDKKRLYSLSKRKSNKTKKMLHELCFWNIKKRKLYKIIPIKKCSIDHLLISPDGSMLTLESTRKNKIIILNSQSGKLIKILPGCSFPVTFSLDSKVLAARHKQGFIEHTIINENLKKSLHNLSAQHIAFLHGCVCITENNRELKIEQYINASEQTKALFTALPQPIRSRLKRKKKENNL